MSERARAANETPRWMKRLISYGSHANPEHSALAEERTRRLRAAIEKLPPQQRECMLLRSSGLRYREIAEILGINTSSVGSLVQRAMARLSEDLS